MFRINKTLIAALLTVASFLAAPALYADRYERTISINGHFFDRRFKIDQNLPLILKLPKKAPKMMNNQEWYEP